MRNEDGNLILHELSGILSEVNLRPVLAKKENLNWLCLILELSQAGSLVSVSDLIFQ